MAGEAEKRLYDAITKGDLAAFQDVLEKDPYLVVGASFAYSRNLLHIAAMWGQVVIVEDLLRRNRRLASDLDSNNSSPLHIAVEEGNFEITSMLLRVAPNMCWSLDCQGMNPIHIAAKNGYVEILEHLLGENPSPAMKRMNCGGTVLHLCVKHGQLMTFKVLVEKYLSDLVHATDDNGDTILHMAVRWNQLEIAQYLTKNTKIFVTTNNSLEYSPMEILEEMPRNNITLEMKKVLTGSSISFLYTLSPNSRARDPMIVVLALIATVAFQAIVNPPGGVWQDDSSTHKAGEAVMAYNRPQQYILFTICNTAAFVTSLLAIVTIIPTDASMSAIAMLGFISALSWSGLSYGISLLMIRKTLTTVATVYLGILILFLSVGTMIFLSFSKKRKQRR